LDIALHSLTNMSDVSKVLTASIVRAITALWNVGQFLWDYIHLIFKHIDMFRAF
jgi:hypothetical protein